MANNSAKAIWKGGLKTGTGNVESQSGIINASYGFSARFEDDPGTNPEEMIASALASCYAMFLSSTLEKDGTPASKITTEVKVTLGKKNEGPHITKIAIDTKGQVSGIDQATFEEKAKHAKENCPVSKVLQAVDEMTLKAELE